MNSMLALNLQRPTLQGVCFLVPKMCVRVCVIVPPQEIPDGGGTAEGKTVIIVGLDSIPVFLLTCLCPRERKTEV